MKTKGGPRIVYNRLLGGWYVVVGPHQTPLSGRFDSKAAAQAWLSGRRTNPKMGKHWSLTMHRGRARAGKQLLVAEVTEHLSEREVHAVAQVIANHFRRPIEVHQPRKGRMFVTRAVPNPTLVHHGLADSASWHIFTANPVAGGQHLPLADIYWSVPGGGARRIAMLLADIVGGPVFLAQNSREQHSFIDHLEGKVGLGTTVIQRREKGVRRNQRPGEVWTTARGGRCKIMSVTPTRVQVLHLETGNREWIDKPEFYASYKPPRRPRKNQRPGRGRVYGERRPPRRTSSWTASKARTLAKRLRVRAEQAHAAGNPDLARHLADGAAMIDRGWWAIDSETLNSLKARLTTPLRNNPSRSRGEVDQHAATELELFIENAFEKRKRNPRRSEVARARRTFRRWHEFGSSRITKKHGPPRVMPETMVKLGELVSVTYLSNKYAGGPDNPKGKTLLYEHTTKRPRPWLVTDPDGRHVHIVGGQMHPTADGLVN
jgi:hypothetical protein